MRPLFMPESPSVFMVAEIGLNHDGKVERAYELARLAWNSGADAVKFQFFRADEFLLPSNPDFPTRSLHALSDDEVSWLTSRLEADGIVWGGTPLGFNSAHTLAELKPAFIKIASGDITHTRLIETVATMDTNLVISTGASYLPEIARARSIALSASGHEPVLLHCISKYPTHAHESNIAFLARLKQEFPSTPIGLSDHSPGPLSSSIAVAAGARLIEKHFTDDPARNGYDHHMSETPESFKATVAAVREVEEVMGVADERRIEEELERRVRSRRSLYWRSSLSPGHLVQESDFRFLRPVHGIEADQVQSLIGRRISRPVAMLDPVTGNDFS